MKSWSKPVIRQLGQTVYTATGDPTSAVRGKTLHYRPPSSRLVGGGAVRLLPRAADLEAPIHPAIPAAGAPRRRSCGSFHAAEGEPLKHGFRGVRPRGGPFGRRDRGGRSGHGPPRSVVLPPGAPTSRNEETDDGERYREEAERAGHGHRPHLPGVAQRGHRLHRPRRRHRDDGRRRGAVLRARPGRRPDLDPARSRTLRRGPLRRPGRGVRRRAPTPAAATPWSSCRRPAPCGSSTCSPLDAPGPDPTPRRVFRRSADERARRPGSFRPPPPVEIRSCPRLRPSPHPWRACSRGCASPSGREPATRRPTGRRSPESPTGTPSPHSRSATGWGPCSCRGYAPAPSARLPASSRGSRGSVNGTCATGWPGSPR